MPPHADNVDLGTACGKLHRVCVLAITDPGDHGLLHCWLCLSMLCLDNRNRRGPGTDAGDSDIIKTSVPGAEA